MTDTGVRPSRTYDNFRVCINPSLPPHTWRLIGPRTIECSRDLADELKSVGTRDGKMAAAGDAA